MGYYGFESLAYYLVRFKENIMVTLLIVLVLYGGLLRRSKERDSVDGFSRIIIDFFYPRKLWILGVLRFLFVMITVMFIVNGLSSIFFYKQYDKFLPYIEIFIAPILCRLIFETFFMFINLAQNVMNISNYLNAEKQSAQENNSNNMADILDTPKLENSSEQSNISLETTPLMKKLAEEEKEGSTIIGSADDKGIACPNCNYNNPEESVFCGKCGAKLL